MSTGARRPCRRRSPPICDRAPRECEVAPGERAASMRESRHRLRALKQFEMGVRKLTLLGVRRRAAELRHRGASQRASPGTDGDVRLLEFETRRPKTSLVEKSTRRSTVSFAARAASSTLAPPISFTRIVRRPGLSRTVSTPAMPAQWTTCVAPWRSSPRRTPASSTSPWTKSKFGWSARLVPPSQSDRRQVVHRDDLVRIDGAPARASRAPMKPAPPVITIRLPLRDTRRV